MSEWELEISTPNDVRGRRVAAIRMTAGDGCRYSGPAILSGRLGLDREFVSWGPLNKEPS